MSEEIKEKETNIEETVREEAREGDNEGKPKKVRKEWAENEAPFYRWLLAAILGIALGYCNGILLAFLTRLALSALTASGNMPYLDAEQDLLIAMASFVGVFIGLWVGLRLLCRTSLRAFLFGRDRKVNVKVTLITGVLYLAGLGVSMLFVLPKLRLDPHPAGLVLLNLVFCLLLVWIQTTTEEILFRGFFLRAICKNEIPPMRKGLLIAVGTSLLFMAGHLANPEVTTMSGIGIVITASTYFFSGFFMFLADLLAGGLEAGVIMHWVNNFFCFVFLRNVVTALETPTILVDGSDDKLGLVSLFSVLIAFLGPIVYLTVRRIKQQPAKALTQEERKPVHEEETGS